MDWFFNKRRAISKLNLSAVKENAIKRHGWTPAQADAAEADYRRFLYLCALYPKKMFVPWTVDLDMFWHEHILDTRRYATDCGGVCGRFIHHNPHIRKSPEAEKEAQIETARMYLNHFDQSGDSSMSWTAASAATAAAFTAMIPKPAPASEKKKSSDSSSSSGSSCSSGDTGISSLTSCSSSHGSTSCSGGSSCSGGGSSCGGGGGCSS